MCRQARRPATRCEQGFTIIEALVATAIIILVGFAAFAACKTIAQASLWTNGGQHGADAIANQATALRSDAASAFAIFVPATDMNGRPNAGQEVDFFSKTDAERPVLWRYFYDAAAQTVQRWDYDPSGLRGVRDVKTGSIDSAAAYAPLKDITSFVASAIGADQLGDPAHNPDSGIAGLLTRNPHAWPVSFDAPGLNVPAAVGGNGIVQVALATKTTAASIHLAAGSFPSGFTVTGVPVWHAIVYRIDQSHRFWLGPASKSHVFIQARVEVSYDNWVTPITWCDMNLLGAPDGLDGNDPHADYKPLEPVEQADTILAACRLSHPLVPPSGATSNPPDPNAVHSPLPGQTAPPCWTQPGPGGRCWPENVAPNWVPPSPLPVDTPPPAWCVTHATSRACPPARSGPRIGR